MVKLGLYDVVRRSYVFIRLTVLFSLRVLFPRFSITRFDADVRRDQLFADPNGGFSVFPFRTSRRGNLGSAGRRAVLGLYCVQNPVDYFQLDSARRFGRRSGLGVDIRTITGII